MIITIRIKVTELMIHDIFPSLQICYGEICVIEYK